MHLAQSACMTLVPQTLTLFFVWRRPATLEVASSILARRDRALGVGVLRREVFENSCCFMVGCIGQLCVVMVSDDIAQL